MKRPPLFDIKPESAPRFVSTHFFENKEQKQPKRKEAKREDQPVQDPVPPEDKNDPNKGQNKAVRNRKRTTGSKRSVDEEQANPTIDRPKPRPAKA